MRMNRAYFLGILIMVITILEIQAIRLKVRCKRAYVADETRAFDYRIVQDEFIDNNEELIIARAERKEVPEKHIVVIIPSYNNKKLYERNLLSVVEQEYSNYHVIYVDDCSSDGTATFVEAFIQKK